MAALRALEDRNSVGVAVRAWVNEFAVSAERFAAGSLTGYWHPNIAVWGAFNDPVGESNVQSYWNPFGRIPRSFRSNMIVEINPPTRGINTNVQGAIARDSNGHRWVLHQGRLHPAKLRITEEMFDRIVGGNRVDVVFSDGRKARYHKVADIDTEPRVLQAQIASFVADCQTVRRHLS